MTTPNKPILMAYDGSADADTALQWASREAVMRGLPLRVVLVDETAVEPLGMTAAAAERVDLAQAELVMKDSGVLNGTTERLSGFPVPTLLELAPESSMIVLGSQGHGRFSEIGVGSVARHLAAHAACPVIAVRAAASPASTRIVVGLDGSPTSAAALKFACERAELTGEGVVAIHGWKMGRRPARVDGQAATIADSVDDRELLLAESIAGIRDSHPDVVILTEAIPVAPAQVLVDASATASLVVVGSRGRGVFKGMLLGSVSQDVLHRAQCPVAIVR